MGGAREWLSLLYWSELNILFGLGDLCLVTDPRLGVKDGLGTSEFGKPRATRGVRRQIGLLWALKQACVVAATYVAASAGVGTVFWALSATAACLYVLSYLLLGERLAAIEQYKAFGIGTSQPSPLVYVVAYVSIVNWVLANPYRSGDGPKVLYSIALLASFVAALIVAGTLTVDGPLVDAWGCYPVSTGLKDLSFGMCPASSLGSYRTCLSLPGTSTCETLKGNTLFVQGPYRVARGIVAVSVAVYVASSAANYRRL